MYNIHLVVGLWVFAISLQKGNIILLSSLNVYFGGAVIFCHSYHLAMANRAG